MYCWNCGKEMNDEELFCPHCAMKQAGIPEPKLKRKLPVLPLVCAVVCILALLGMLLLLAVPGGTPLQPTEPVDPYSVELPDLASFLNTQYTGDDTSAYTHYVTCVLKKDPGKDALREFVELLQKEKYQLVLDDSWDYFADKADCTDYIFHYKGKGEGIKWVSHKDGYRYHVKLSIYEHTTKNRVTVIIYMAPGFELADPGVDAKSLQ